MSIINTHTQSPTLTSLCSLSNPSNSSLSLSLCSTPNIRGCCVQEKQNKMLLKAAPAFGLLNSHGENLGALFSSAASSSSSLSVKNFEGRNGNGFVVCAAKHTNSKPLTGVVFEPFEEVKKELMLVPSVPQDSLARHKFADESEAAINEQIKWAFFDFYLPSVFQLLSYLK